MCVVAGVDFGTQSVRVSLFDSEKGRLGAASAEYPVKRKREDPDHATQSHSDHMTALAAAMRDALKVSSIQGSAVAALALDTTGSTVIPLAQGLTPIDDYYLWCDHRAKNEAAEITAKARTASLEALNWCGGVYSSEWGFSKLLHWLRNNPEKRPTMVTAMEHCDLVAAALCGITNPAEAPRSICAMGHKWMWNESLGGLPPEEFLTEVDPLLAGVRPKLDGRYETSNQIAGHLSSEWAEKLGLKAGIPIPVGAFDAHWDAIGAGIREGDVVNVVGTSTCMMAIAKQVGLIPGVCGVVKGSIHPDYFGIEAGLSAVGDIFEAIARRAGTTVAKLSEGLDEYKAGSSGLLRFSWDNGDRTVLVNPELGGVTLGWTLTTTASDELFAAIEGTAFHTRIILERMAEHGVTINRVINGGGIPQKNPTLSRVYANVFNKPVLGPAQEVTSLGSAIFAFMAAGAFKTIEEAQDRLCPSYQVIEPNPAEAAVYEKLFALYRKLYFGLGQPGSEAVAAGDVLPALRKLRG
ncbi:MAG: ribulokinase [Acidobacteria bacterium]|nr:ribulokinase [Acidobacteriota bacterium]